MITAKTVFKSTLTAATLSLALLGAAPAFADSSVQFGFQFGGPGGHHQYDNGNQGYGTRCLTNREVVRGIDASGYDDVSIGRDYGRQVDVTGTRGNWLYAMRVDKCSGQVGQPRRIQQQYPDNNFPGNGFPGNGYPGGHSHPGHQYPQQGYPQQGYPQQGGGFGFEFNFGN